MNCSKHISAAALIVLPASAAHAQDLAAGANSFKKCAPCHDIDETAKNKVGVARN